MVLLSRHLIVQADGVQVYRDPTPEEQAASDAAEQQAIVDAQTAMQRADADAATKSNVVADGSTLVGLTLKKLTGAQLATLVEYFAALHGVIDQNGVIQPTDQWR